MKRSRRSVRQMPKMYGDLHKPKRSWSGVLRWVQIILWGGAGLSVIYALFLSGWFNVRHVEVSGTLFSSENTVKSLIPLGTNIWTIDQNALTARIATDPSILSATISRGLPDGIAVHVLERSPVMLWVSGDKTAILDETGVCFALYSNSTLPAASTPAGALLVTLPKVQDAAALPITQGQQVASIFFARFVRNATAEMARVVPELSIDHMEVAETTYDITVISKQGVRIELNTLGDAQVQVRNLARLLHQNKLQSTSHIADLRTDRWAYVTP